MTTSRRTPPQPLRRVFGAPVLLALLSLIGLILGLTGDGWRDALASLLLFPLAVFAAHWRRRS